MSYLEKIQKIDSLQAAIQAHGPIQQELLNKINYKLRLEWNYTSNSMEGNSLTKRETRTIMVNNIEVKDKPIKDVMEIKNHDTVIKTIMKMGKGELNISESRIKEIHRGIMYEEDSEKMQYVGQWRNVDSYMYNADGERYDFAPHAEVKNQMHNLINWLNGEKEKIERAKKDAIHPIFLAFRFHIEYLTIHPFYDGNGRTARILSNLILISYGFPPIYIREKEKQSYYRYLTDIQTYGGDSELFYQFMCDLLLRSMEMILNAIAGKDVEDEDDIDKEIALFKAGLNKDSERKELKGWDSISKIIRETGIPLFEKFIKKLSQFDDIFHHNEHRIIFNTYGAQPYNHIQRHGGNMLSTAGFPETLNNWLTQAPVSLNLNLSDFGIEYYFKGYKFSRPFDLSVYLFFSFDQYMYRLTCIINSDVQILSQLAEYNYDKPMKMNNINTKINEIAKDVLKDIQAKSES